MDAAGEAAQLPGARVLPHGHAARRREDPLGDEDLPRLGLVAQPGGQVRDAADRRVVVPAVEADPARGWRSPGRSRSPVRGRAPGVPRTPPGPRTRVRMATLIRIARAGPSSQRTGSLKKTIRPSPANRSSVPSKRKIRSPSAAWYSPRTPITSSGSLASANGVNPRRSQKTTTISRRWLSRNDSSPESTISSASCGERNRRSRPIRSSCATCSATRASSSLVPCGQLVGLTLDGVLVALDPRQGGHPRQQLALVDRLGEEVVRSRLERLDLLLFAARRDHHDGQVRRVRRSRIPRHTS